MQLISNPVMRLQLGDWVAFSPTFKAVSMLHLHPPFQLHPKPWIMRVAKGTNISAVHMEKHGKTCLWLVAWKP